LCFVEVRSWNTYNGGCDLWLYSQLVVGSSTWPRSEFQVEGCFGMVLVSVVSRTRSPTFGRNRPCSQRGGKTAEKIVALPSPASCITSHKHATHTHTWTSRIRRFKLVRGTTATSSLARCTAVPTLRPSRLPLKTNCDFTLLFCVLTPKAVT
jgi:hypothetical protein